MPRSPALTPQGAWSAGAQEGCTDHSARRNVRLPTALPSPPPSSASLASCEQLPGAFEPCANRPARRLGAILVAFGVCLAALACALAAQRVVANAGAWASSLVADAAPPPMPAPSALPSIAPGASPADTATAGSADAAVSACAAVEQAGRVADAGVSLPEGLAATGQGAAGAALRFFACARAATVLNERSQVKSAVEAYRAFTGSYPNSPQDLLQPDATGHRYLLAWPGSLPVAAGVATP